MIRYFAAHPTVANILMLAIIAIGMFSVQHLNKESFPVLKQSKVQVSVVWPGASPEDVEEGVCNPLEDATDGISFLKEQVCDARDNMAIFTLEMQEQGDIQLFTDDIKVALDGIQNFPDSVEDPIIKQLGRTSLVVKVAITADQLSTAELKNLAEYYRNRMLEDPRIPIVKVAGFSTHQLQVLVPAESMRKYNLSVQDISSLVGAQSVQLPAGTLETRDKDYQIRFDNSRKSSEALRDLVILNTEDGGEIRLGDIARVEDRFEFREQYIELDGRPAAVLEVSKNTIDDTLKVFDAVQTFVDRENAILPQGTHLTITQDVATGVRDRLRLLLSNGWQGLLLAGLALFLFFNWRYTFWVALGLPISFLGGLALMVFFGVSINMISMIALLMAIGILMDDAIVISESIEHEYAKGKTPLEAAVDGTKKVFRGVFSSFLTSALLFGSLLMMKGDIGQILGVLPVVLLSVLTVSLIEAMLVLPHHLRHSLEHAHEKRRPAWRGRIENGFLRMRENVGKAADMAIRYRYLTLGLALAMLVFSVGLIATGTVKFKAFPDLEGNTVDARVLLPQGTPLEETRAVVAHLLRALAKTNAELSAHEPEPLVRHVQVVFGEHADVPENGAHLATITLDVLNTEVRNTPMSGLTRRWRENAGDLPNVIGIQFREPKVGPAGRAIHVRLSGESLDELSRASWDVQNWLRGYQGVSNLLDDLRPGKPRFSVRLLPGAQSTGLTARDIAFQLRAAYQGLKVTDVYQGREAYEVITKLDRDHGRQMDDFENFYLFTSRGEAIPLSRVARVGEKRDWARIGHVNHHRTVNIYGDVDADLANTSEIIAGLQRDFMPGLLERYPNIRFHFKGEVENGAETKLSILSGFGLGALGVFLLLSLQFRNYREPFIVLLNIPLALIGAIWGHFIMGLDFTLPSMIGFVSLAGVVVNDSILLVEFVKYRVREGMVFHDAARQAVRDRFRAIFLTSVTTVAGMTPLLFETSSQALILVPLVTSIVFGMLTSTLLIMLVLPATYSIMEDMGLVDRGEEQPSLRPDALPEA
jgi:multidrug efflux pump subunit AcrB